MPRGGSAGAGGSFTTIPNPEQQKFEELWRPVQAYSDRAVAALSAMSFSVAKGQGFLTERTTSSIRQTIDNKIPDTITGPKSQPQKGAPSPGGLTAAETVSRGGWPSNMQKTAVGVMYEESGFNARAQNPSGARGLFQIMPGTASGVGANYDQLYDPLYNSSTGKAVYDAQGWGAWDAYPPSGDAMARGDQPITGYAKGGVVPGPKGSPQRAIVHGGEHITPSNGVATMKAPDTDVRIDKLIREIQGLARAVGYEVREGFNLNMERGPNTQRSLGRGVDGDMNRRLMGGPALSRAR